jgi:hypothetical protein
MSTVFCPARIPDTIVVSPQGGNGPIGSMMTSQPLARSSARDVCRSLSGREGPL